MLLLVILSEAKDLLLVKAQQILRFAQDDKASHALRRRDT